MYVCLYVCVCMCGCVCVYVCVNVCIYVCMYAINQTRCHDSVYFGHIPACIHTCKHTQIHTNINTYLHTLPHTYIHTHIHIYIHTCIQPDAKITFDDISPGLVSGGNKGQTSESLEAIPYDLATGLFELPYTIGTYVSVVFLCCAM